MATATEDILKFIKFDRELSNQLLLARQEITEPENEPTVTRDDWMVLSEIRPILSENDGEIDDVLADVNYDFVSHRNNYSSDELEEIESNWV